MDLEVTTVNNTARRIPGDDKSFNEMENVQKKIEELCEAVAAKG